MDSPTADGDFLVKQPVMSHAAKLLIGEFDGLTEETVSKEFKSEIIIRESLKKFKLEGLIDNCLDKFNKKTEPRLCLLQSEFRRGLK